MEQITYKLETFEGPMDLLLHLISRHKLDIMDVPILDLVEQYLEAVKQMQQENLELASEFLEMAARLVYIKTVSLLPVHEEMEELTQELRGELLEYRDCKLVAQELKTMANGFDYFSREAVPMHGDMTYTRIHEPVELYAHYLAAVGKRKRRLPPPVEAFSGIIAHTIVSVASRIHYVLRALRRKGSRQFSDLFMRTTSRSEMVATFLAVLSLAKSKRIAIEGDAHQAQIILLSDKGEVTDEFTE